MILQLRSPHVLLGENCGQNVRSSMSESRTLMRAIATRKVCQRDSFVSVGLQTRRYLKEKEV